METTSACVHVGVLNLVFDCLTGIHVSLFYVSYLSDGLYGLYY